MSALKGITMAFLGFFLKDTGMNFKGKMNFSNLSTVLILIRENVQAVKNWL